MLLIALERTHHLVGQRESKNADSVSALATDMSSAICFSFCFLFADSLNMFAQSLTSDKQLRTTGHFLSPYNHFMILPSEMLVEHAPVSAPRAKKLVEHWLRRRHGSRAPGPLEGSVGLTPAITPHAVKSGGCRGVPGTTDSNRKLD